MSALYKQILPSSDMITLDISPDSKDSSSLYLDSVETISKDFQNYQKMMEDSIKKIGWNLENFEAAMDKGGNPFEKCTESDENCYQKLLKKEIFLRTDYEDALEYKEMCIDWIRENPEIHLENVMLEIKELSEFGKDYHIKLEKILETGISDIMDVLQDLLEDSFKANDLKVFLVALANGADILQKNGSTNESIFDEIVKHKDRYQYFKISYHFIFRHKLLLKSNINSVMLLAYNNKDPVTFVELANYNFLNDIFSILPLEISKFIEIATSFGQFKTFHKSLEDNVYLSYSYKFYEKLFANTKLKNEAKHKIVELIFNSHKSNIEALFDHRDQLKKITMNVDERLDEIFIMENNIIWKENVTFSKRFKKFYQKHYNEIITDTNIKYDCIDLITSAIYYDNIEAMKIILNKAFERAANTRKQLKEAYFKNQGLIGINELISIKFLYDESMKNDFTLLTYAIQKDNKDAISELLRRGAHLLIKDDYYHANLLYFEKNPELLEHHFDNCLEWYDQYLDQEESIKCFYYEKNPQLLDERKNLVFKKKLYSERILLNFKNFITPDEFHHKNEKIFDAILDLADTKTLSHLLKHPLLSSLIYLKWNSLSKIFLTNFLMIILFFISFVYYSLFRLNFINNYNITYQYFYSISGFLVFSILLFFIGREIFQFYLIRWSYFTHVIDWLQIILIVLIILALPIYDFDKETIKGFSALGILFAAMELSVVIRSVSLSLLSVYVIIFEQVIKTYLKISLLFGIYLASFSFCFMILFGNESTSLENKDSNDTNANGSGDTNGNDQEQPKEGLEFGNYVPTAIKTLVMFVGEYEGGTIWFNSQYYWGYLVFFIFICVMALVAVNLLHGLAVSDVQEIIQKAELNSLIFKANMLPKYEKAINQLAKTFLFKRIDYYVEYFVNSRILVNDNRSVNYAETFDKCHGDDFRYRFGLKVLHINREIMTQAKQILRNRHFGKKHKDPLRIEIDEIKKLLQQVLHNTEHFNKIDVPTES